ncbi:MAG: hypothetical protein GKR88_15330 [Flavobacteriaceae bacterium]|nr:MAG: hypothetical protein GKR88_15330 [Flavobacteriaceae bacterium]
MKNFDFIQVKRRLVSYLHEFDIHKGAIFNLEELRHNTIMVKYLCKMHTIDPYCLVGYIGKLYRIREEILFLEKYGDMKYVEYLQEMVRKGVYSLPKKSKPQ